VGANFVAFGMMQRFNCAYKSPHKGENHAIGIKELIGFKVL
jgi:hypothetical protein